ncbi:hypothetical protein N7G274_009968 [Stereocaulon virgatum]|uniref:Uncharacterized protein n=1 Tax=Stereocaulon virgatum TaxID=373712 RepID=A0ABR3ZXN0_9LECA
MVFEEGPQVDTTLDLTKHKREVIADLSFLVYGRTHLADSYTVPDVTVVSQLEGTDDSVLINEASRHLHSSNGPDILLVQMRPTDTTWKAPMMRLTAFNRESGYHSAAMTAASEVTHTQAVFEIHYNFCGGKLRGFQSKHPHAIRFLRFQYNIKNGRSSYLLFCTDPDFELFTNPLIDSGPSPPFTLHPFALHLVFLFKGALSRSSEVESLFSRLLDLETILVREETMFTAETTQDTKQMLRDLHNLFRDMVVGENGNRIDLAVTKCLIRDLERWHQLVQSTPGAFQSNAQSHQRLNDAFLCLQEFCEDRAWRLAQRLRRVQNLIALTYNLMANRDSLASQTIATESTNIAHEARQDSSSMKTIAVLTMFFLPATFVSSLLGTNLVALNTNGTGRAKFVVSELWWIYLVSAVPLTLFTLFVWWFWLKRRAKARQRRYPPKNAKNDLDLFVIPLNNRTVDGDWSHAP